VVPKATKKQPATLGKKPTKKRR